MITNIKAPKIVSNISEMQEITYNSQKSIGFVPTMGYLHEGHISLVKEATKNNDIVVVSIYVNPSQFSPNEDLDNYPRDLDKDISLLAEHGVDYVFFPDNDMMYQDGFKTWVEVDEITKILCGKSRATHFKGVTTIVNKLINIVNPTRMYMGEKDFQQLAVIRQMVRDLNQRVEVVGCELFREDDGLAMSSRNKYLSKLGRESALCLSKALKLAQELFTKGIVDFAEVKQEMQKLIETASGITDYIELVDSTTLESKNEISSGDRIVMAVKIEKTRLIDNMEIR